MIGAVRIVDWVSARAALLRRRRPRPPQPPAEQPPPPLFDDAEDIYERMAETGEVPVS
jgi:hypothetical protein